METPKTKRPSKAEREAAAKVFNWNTGEQSVITRKEVPRKK